MSRRAVVLVAGLAVVLGLLLNFNSLLLRLGDHLPGTEDQAALSLLGAWWPAHQLGLPDALVIHSFIGAPHLINHLRNLPVLPAAVFALLRPALGPVAAFNLLLVLSQIATHGTLMALLLRWRVPPWWAALAATAFILSPWYSAAVARADLITADLWPLPLALLAWQAWLDRPTAGRAVLVALALCAAVWTGVQNSLWIAAVWLPYAIFSGREVWGQAENRGQLSIALLIFLVLVLLYPLPALVRTLQGNEPAYGPLPAMTVRRSFVGWAFRTSPAILLAAVATLFRGRSSRRLAFWWALAAYAGLAGVGLLPDPFQFVLAGLGVPYRPLAEPDYLLGPALIALLIGLCHAWQAELSRAPLPLMWKGIGAGLALAALALNPATFQAVPQHEVSVPAFYREIAAEPEDYLVLEYPFGLSSLADGRTLGRAAYLARDSVWDLKRSVGGLAPYVEPLLFNQVRQESFLFPEALSGDDRESSAQALGVAVREWRIGYVVVHPDLLGAAEQDIVRELARLSEALCPPVERDGLVIYRARWHPAGCEAS